ncbi:MAG: cupin domain-containing protein [Pseudomonadota bacterium]
MTTARAGDLGVREIVGLLNMARHPEGGWYVETYRAGQAGNGRAACTAIYYLLEAGEVSAWHRVDADETWLWHAGGPLALTTSPEGKGAEAVRLGPDLRAGQRPQAVVPAGHWQTAESPGAWTLASCVVAPGFEFDGFELAPADWRPEV